MWNLLRVRKNHGECSRLRDALENVADVTALSSVQQKHLAACPACQAASADISMTRIVLRDVRAALPEPWFAPRVMAAIAARESELRQSLEAWAAVPRLAARLTWISGLALLVASTWLYQLPKFTPISGNESAVESLFDSSQSSASQDDVVPLENAR
jgi:predicted anti-sigma-YlaC factor YlaD